MLDTDGRPACQQDLCQSFVCNHDGVCYIDQVSGQPQCKCTDDMYTGRRCEMDKCQSLFCKNGGIGHRDSQGKCVCECTKQFTGTTCQEIVSDADKFDCEGVGSCLHGGKCVHMNGTSVCSCSLDYVGSNCDTKIDSINNPCRDFTCKNGGICQVVMGDNSEYRGQCLCDEEYKGVYCQDKNRCYKHCLNGGTCYYEGTSVRCHCLEGWSGSRCSMNFNSGKQ